MPADNGRLIDIDELLPDDWAIRLGGQVYPMPGDLPVETVLRLHQLYERAGDSAARGGDDDGLEALSELHDHVVDIIRVRTPDADLQLGPQAMGQLVTHILMQFGGTPTEGGQKNPPARRAQTPQTRTSKPGSSSRTRTARPR
jgi:hypothetical protein